MHGVDRTIEAKLKELLGFFPAVALLGPRQCGKTTLSHKISSTMDGPSIYLDLENISDKAKLDDCVGYQRFLSRLLSSAD